MFTDPFFLYLIGALFGLALLYLFFLYPKYIPHFVFLVYCLLPLFYAKTFMTPLPLTTIIVLVLGPVLLWRSKFIAIQKLWPIFCYLLITILTTIMNDGDIWEMKSAFIPVIIATFCLLSFSDIKTEREFTIFTYIVIGWTALNAVFSILQFAIGESFYVISTAKSFEKGFEIGGLQRGYGLVGMATELGLVFSFGVPLLGAAFCDRKEKILFGSLLFISAIGLFLTYSRGAIIGSYLAIFGILLIRKKKALLSLYIACSMALVFLFIIYTIAVPSKYIKHFKAEDGSAMGRLPYINIGLKMFSERPASGFGYGGYAKDCTKYGSRIHVEAHNTYVQVLVEFGIAGFIIFLYIIYKSIKGYLNYIRWGKSPTIMTLCMGCLGGLVAVLLSSFVHCFEWKMFFWLPLILGLVLDTFLRNERLLIQPRAGDI